MLKHNLCARISADIEWEFIHSNVFITLLGIILIEFVVMLSTFVCYKSIPHVHVGLVNTFVIMSHHHELGSNFFYDDIVVNVLLIGTSCLFGLLFYITPKLQHLCFNWHKSIHQYIRKYRINVRDAYEQKRLKHLEK